MFQRRALLRYVLRHVSHHHPIPALPTINGSCVHQPSSVSTGQPLCEKHHFFVTAQNQSMQRARTAKAFKIWQKKKMVQMLSICGKQMLSSLASLWQTYNSIQKIQHSQSGLTTMLPDMSLCFSCTFHVFPHAVLLPIIYDWSAPSLPFSISFNLCNSDLQWLIINTKMYMCVNKFGRI